MLLRLGHRLERVAVLGGAPSLDLNDGYLASFADDEIKLAAVARQPGLVAPVTVENFPAIAFIVARRDLFSQRAQLHVSSHDAKLMTAYDSEALVEVGETELELKVVAVHRDPAGAQALRGRFLGWE